MHSQVNTASQENTHATVLNNRVTLHQQTLRLKGLQSKCWIALDPILLIEKNWLLLDCSLIPPPTTTPTPSDNWSQ